MYRAAWTSAAVVFSIIGWAGALLTMSAGHVFGWAGMAAIVGLAAAGTVPEYRGPDSPTQPARYVTWALRAALGFVAVIGTILIAGIGGATLTALLIVSSPPLVHRYLRQPIENPVLRLPSPPEPTPPPPPRRLIVWPSPDTMTTEQLCRGWRATFAALQFTQNVADRVQLVQVRAAYLDALQDRDPDNFARWLTSGARAAGDPIRYLNRPTSSPQNDNLEDPGSSQ